MTSGGVTSGAAKAGRESALMATWGDQGRRGSLGHTHGQLLGFCWTEISRGGQLRGLLPLVIHFAAFPAAFAG